jgi:flagellum-specific peptidoglycan hydrolase FlgJ
MKPQDFLDMLVPAAQACQRASGIPASFTLAQAALESSWGAKAPGCNLFGIKANKAWTGPVTVFATHEVINGARIAIDDRFRAYRTFGECLADRAEFFRNNPRYAKCFLEDTGHGWARAVARAGYATDPSYAESLIAVIDGRNMTRFDNLPVLP